MTQESALQEPAICGAPLGCQQFLVDHMLTSHPSLQTMAADYARALARRHPLQRLEAPSRGSSALLHVRADHPTNPRLPVP